tara:strand:+ start:8067 stop:8345 length:279 start_codon:yes stop_codon:yes gene_type:complete
MAFATVGFTSYAASKRGNAPSMYGYKTADTIATVNTAGYFNALSGTLEIGDIIHCVTSTGGTIVVSLVYVLSNASGVVDVSDGTVLANTDSD